MHDKYVRRRRAVLAVLVAVSLILLTAYFGEAENSPLHSVQQGIVEVFTPIEEGASTVLSPVRDLAGWVSSTLHAKSQNAELRSANAKLTSEYALNSTAAQKYAQLAATVKLSDRLNLNQYGPVYANKITYDPQVWYERLEVDKGSGSGIAVGDPVLSAEGLVGDVSFVGAGYAEVSELSSPKYYVEAQIIDPSGKSSVGGLIPEVGNTTTLQAELLPNNAVVQDGDQVVTAGYSDATNASIHSLYPPGIPIGTVSDADYNTLLNDGTVNVSPDVDLRNVDQVEILTKVNR